MELIVLLNSMLYHALISAIGCLADDRRGLTGRNEEVKSVEVQHIVYSFYNKTVAKLFYFSFIEKS